jgi:uncharacterized membrane protein
MIRKACAQGELTQINGDVVRSWLDRLSRWLLAAVFLFAAVPKILAPTTFAETIGAYGLLPEVALWPAAIVLSYGECLAALGLLFGRRWALVVTALFLLLFIGVLSYGIYLGLDIDCGCFGPDDPEHAAFSGLRTALVRDVLLLFPLCYSFWYVYIHLNNGGRS